MEAEPISEMRNRASRDWGRAGGAERPEPVCYRENGLHTYTQYTKRATVEGKGW